METTTTAPAKARAHKDVHEIVNGKIVDQLEQGIAPWRVPWMKGGIPMNLLSRKPYRGMNLLLLAMLGYDNNVFLTEKQLDEIGGSIRPKQKSHMVLSWNTQKAGAGNAPEGKEKNKPFKLSFYSVYNFSQCAGILGECISSPIQETNPIGACEGIVAYAPNLPMIKHKDTNPCYDPIQDLICLPKQKAFPNDAAYFSALFHQMIHATGHHTRLNRMGLVQMPEFGCDPYSQEELIAEIGACHLRSLTGIASEFDEVLDVKGWIPKFKRDKYMIFTACVLAQKAVDYILNYKPEVEDTNAAAE